MEGTYPLPEAELDRFFFKLLVAFPHEPSLGPSSIARLGPRSELPAAIADGSSVLELQDPRARDPGWRRTFRTTPFDWSWPRIRSCRRASRRRGATCATEPVRGQRRRSLSAARFTRFWRVGSTWRRRRPTCRAARASASPDSQLRGRSQRRSRPTAWSPSSSPQSPRASDPRSPRSPRSAALHGAGRCALHGAGRCALRGAWPVSIATEAFGRFDRLAFVSRRLGAGGG